MKDFLGRYLLPPDAAAQLFAKAIKDDARWDLTRRIVYQNTLRDSWLCGGFLYRTLAHALHDRTPPESDIDILTQDTPFAWTLPHGWKQRVNRYGNPKLVGPTFTIDIIPLSTVHSINRRGVEPTIENYRTGVPFSVQAITLDMRTGLIEGKGLEALTERSVSINNYEEALHDAKVRGQGMIDLLRAKAYSLGFTPRYI